MNDHTITVVNVISSRYSGSTWLNLMLGSHSDAISIGELKIVLRGGRAVCGLHGYGCALWGGFAFDDEMNIFEWLAQQTGRRVFIVNNSRNTLPFQPCPRVRSRFIHLVRDGRAVVASDLRKRTSPSAFSASRCWARHVRRDQRLLRRQDPSSVARVTYEDLALNNEGELERLCDFMDLPYEPAMRRYWESDHHYIGGSPSALAMLANLRAQDLPDTPMWSSLNAFSRENIRHYEGLRPERFIDERWKRELTARQLWVFALIAGRANRKLGYGRSLDRGHCLSVRAGKGRVLEDGNAITGPRPWC